MMTCRSGESRLGDDAIAAKRNPARATACPRRGCGRLVWWTTHAPARVARVLGGPRSRECGQPTTRECGPPTLARTARTLARRRRPAVRALLAVVRYPEGDALLPDPPPAALMASVISLFGSFQPSSGRNHLIAFTLGLLITFLGIRANTPGLASPPGVGALKGRKTAAYLLRLFRDRPKPGCCPGLYYFTPSVLKTNWPTSKMRKQGELLACAGLTHVQPVRLFRSGKNFFSAFSPFVVDDDLCYIYHLTQLTYLWDWIQQRSFPEYPFSGGSGGNYTCSR